MAGLERHKYYRHFQEMPNIEISRLLKYAYLSKRHEKVDF